MTYVRQGDNAEWHWTEERIETPDSERIIEIAPPCLRRLRVIQISQERPKGMHVIVCALCGGIFDPDRSKQWMDHAGQQPN